MRAVLSSTFAAGLWAAAGPAAAHPHVWIDAAAELSVADGRLTASVVEWTLDPMLSAVLIHDYDADDDGRLDDAEQRSMGENAFADVADYGFFTHLRVDGDVIAVQQQGALAARIDGAQVIYRFSLEPLVPVSPVLQSVALAFYDESFYIEMTVTEDSFSLTGGEADGCLTTLGPDRDHPIFFGLVIPTKVDLTCGAGS